MAKRQKKTEKQELGGGGAPFGHNPFGRLRGAGEGGERGPSEAPGEAPGEAPDEARAAAEETAKSLVSGKWVVRQERKGHGGKTVTVAKGPPPPEGWESLAKTVGRALGCRASAEGGELAVSGDQRERLAGWLRGRGAREVVLGN